MGVNWSSDLYAAEQDLYGRPVTFIPLASNPSGSAFLARGIYDTNTTNVPLDDGSYLSDQQTILDIRELEFPIIPVQGDHVIIDVDTWSGAPAEGEFVITNCWRNGGGETTLQLQKWEGTPTVIP
jgi:hypothetical protein